MPRLVYLKLDESAPVDSIPVSIPKVKGDDGKTVPKGGKPQSVRFGRSEKGNLYELHENQIAHVRMVARSDRLVGPVPSEKITHADGSITVQRKPEWDAKLLANKIEHHQARINEAVLSKEGHETVSMKAGVQGKETKRKAHEHFAIQYGEEIANRRKKIEGFKALVAAHKRVRMADVAFVLPAQEVLVEVVPAPDPEVAPPPPPATTAPEPQPSPPPPPPAATE